MTGAELIAQERKEQIEKHGRTEEADVIENNQFQLADAASHLIARGDMEPENEKFILSKRPFKWDPAIWIKMYRKSYMERLIIAGALIAAEIDRLKG